MPALTVRTRAVGPWPMNAYALVCPQTGASALVDPGADAGTLLDMLAGTSPGCIILTHTHPDHTGALDELQSQLNIPIYAHPGPHYQGTSLRAEHAVRHGDELAIGACTVRIYEAPGHIADQICLQDRGGVDILVGDSIFFGGPGRTWSPEGFQTTLHTLRSVVLTWPDDSICHPGHGPGFRLGDLRPQIAAFCARSHPAGFFGDAVW